MESSNKSSTSIKNWAVDDRPREKLLSKGKESLSDSELLAILISTGSKNKSAVETARYRKKNWLSGKMEGLLFH